MDFTYEKAGSFTQALKLKAEYKEKGVFIAGGTDLLVDIRNNILEPEAVIDISDLDEINYIRQEDNQVKIGAMTRIAQIEKSSIVHSHAPILYKASKDFANPLINNMATLGGNLINASPAADMATPLLVLGAKVVLKSANGERVIPLEELFSGVRKTNHRSDELLAEISFNGAQGKKCEFLKLGQRNGTSISIASLSLLFDIAGGVIGDDLRLAVGSVAPVPLRARKTEGVLRGVEPSARNIKLAGDMLKCEVTPITDVRGTAEYRMEMVAALLLMAFQNLGYTTK